MLRVLFRSSLSLLISVSCWLVPILLSTLYELSLVAWFSCSAESLAASKSSISDFSTRMFSEKREMGGKSGERAIAGVDFWSLSRMS